MPSTRSGGGASPESGEEGGTAQLLEEAAAELSSEIAARKVAEERLAELEAQFADYSAEDRAFATPGPAGDPEEEEGEEEEEEASANGQGHRGNAVGSQLGGATRAAR